MPRTKFGTTQAPSPWKDGKETEVLTGIKYEQLRYRIRSGMFVYGVHYRDLNDGNSSRRSLQFNPEEINKLFAIPPEKR